MCLYFLKDDTLGYRQNEVMVDLLGVVKQLHAPRPAHGRRDDPEPPHRVLPRPRQRVPADALPVLRGDRRGHRRGRQRQGRRPPHRGHPLLEVPVPGDQRRDRRVGDGGQPVPPAQDPLLDAHHRVEPGALRAPGGGAQRAAAPGRRLHRRHRPLPARRHALPERRHPPHLLRRQAAAAHPPRVLQRRGRGGRAARRLHRDRRDLRAARHAHALPAQAGARRVVQPPRGLQPRRARVLDDPRPLGPRAVPLRQHHGEGARRAGVGEGAARRPRRSATAARAGAARSTSSSTGSWRSLPRRWRPSSRRSRPTTAWSTTAERRRVALLVADLPAGRPQVLAVGRRRGRRGRPSPAARGEGPRAVPARPRRLAGAPAAAHPRPPARRGPRRSSRSSRPSSSTRAPRRRPRTSTRSATSPPASRRSTATTASPSSTRSGCPSGSRTWWAGCSTTSSTRASSRT